MADWQGFTDADLKRMQKAGGEGPKIVKPVIRKTTQQSNKKPINKRPVKPKQKADKTLPQSAYLGKAKCEVEEKAVKSVDEKQPTEKTSVKPETQAQTQNSEEIKEKELITDEKEVQNKEMQKLENVHRRQKEMEEKNRRKKDLLSKEIAMRKKKALAESSKLVKVQAELAKLDQLLSNDVSVVRDKIDDACYEYNQAKKRFEQAEQEYIQSKMDLHKKTTLKEDLTEHLYHLIEANEERKSKKLEELLHALDVEESEQNENKTEQLDKQNKTENVEKKLTQEKEQKLENTTASLHGDSSETK